MGPGALLLSRRRPCRPCRAACCVMKWWVNMGMNTGGLLHKAFVGCSGGIKFGDG